MDILYIKVFPYDADFNSSFRTATQVRALRITLHWVAVKELKLSYVIWVCVYNRVSS